MDPSYIPCDGILPDRLRDEMLLLRHYDNIVSTQVNRVIDAALPEWQVVDKKIEASAAAIEQEERRAKHRAECLASLRAREAASSSNERATDWASIVADSSEHAADLLLLPTHLAGGQQTPRRPPPSATGYYLRLWPIFV